MFRFLESFWSGQAYKPFGQAYKPFGQAYKPFGQAYKPFGQAYKPFAKAITSSLFRSPGYSMSSLPFWIRMVGKPLTRSL
jgi:hypothetical protein